MSMTVGRVTFSPGPWFALGHSVHKDTNDLSALCDIAQTKVHYKGSLRISAQEAAANAQLIAAAPDLLEAARLTVLHFQRTHASGAFQGDDEHEAWTALNAAIAKAEGK